MIFPEQPARTAASAGPATGLDVRVLALASLAAVLGWIVGHAFGGDLIATVVCASIMPWITAFLAHPGPHRVRRVAAVLVFSGLVTSCRKAVAAVRPAGSAPPGHGAHTAGEPATVATAGVDAVSATARQLTHAWLRNVTLTAAIALVPAGAFVAASEAIRDPALASLRPTVRVPDDIVAHAGNQAATHVTYNVTAADNAGHPLVPMCQPSSGALFKVGKTRVACSAIDASGKRGDARFDVTVLRGGTPQPADRRRPALTVPDDFTHDAATPRGARVTYAASARDARDGALTPDCLPISGSLFALGRTRVACTATDSAGNTARARFTVTVARAGDADDTPPDITVPDAIRTPATSSDGADVVYAVSAIDNRDGSLKPSCEPASGSVMEIGMTTVGCSARDSAGNTAKESFTITVTPETTDRTAPRIIVPDPIRAPATSDAGAKITYLVTAEDRRDGPLRPDCNPRSGSAFEIGTTGVRCSAQDAAGNRAAKSFTITVTAEKPPAEADRTPPDISVPDPIQTRATSGDGARVTYTVAAVDNRDGPVKASCNPTSGSIFDNGTTTVICMARDKAGNRATDKFTIAVIDGGPRSSPATDPLITVTASAIRDSYDGPCPPPADASPYFKGVISVSRGPVTVRYQWLSSNGGSADPNMKEITFSGSGPQEKTVYFTQRVWPSDTGGSLTDWIALYVRSPTAAESNRVSYTVTCTTPVPP